jgi:predicted Zn-ribbon and HTH transcriptional regulator
MKRIMAVTHLKQKGTLNTKTFTNLKIKPLKMFFTFLMVLSISSNLKGQEYLLLLNPADCFKCNLQFSQIQHFINSNQINVSILTPFADKSNAKMLMDKFNLNLTNFQLINNVKRYKKYCNEDLNSKLIIEYENKIIFNEFIPTIDTCKIPILKSQRPIEIKSFRINNNVAPFYGNEAFLFNKNILLKNLIYQKLYIQKDFEFLEFKLHDSIYEHILNKKFSNDTILINKQKKFTFENNLAKIKYLAVFSGNYLYTIIEIPIIGIEENTYLSSYHIVKFDSNLEIMSIIEINDEFNYKGNLFWSTFIFEFAIEEVENRLFLFITKGHDNNKLNRGDSSLYILASYKLIDDVFSFEKIYNNKLPSFYVEKGHFYKNIWPKIELNNNLGGLIGFQYINELKILNGESITLKELKTDRLLLPTNPGGKSIKPFDIITFKYQNNLLNIVVWKKNQTWLYTYTVQGILVKKHKLMNSIIKPAVVINKNQLFIINGFLNGSLTYAAFTF